MSAPLGTHTVALQARRGASRSPGGLASALARVPHVAHVDAIADDAGGLGISDRFMSQIRGLTQAARNANDGISLAQTAESALANAGTRLQRMRTLALQSATAADDSADRGVLQEEVSALGSEVDALVSSTRFDDRPLWSARAAGAPLQVAEGDGTLATDSVLPAVHAAVAGADAAAADTASAIDIGSVDGACEAIRTIDRALGRIADRRTAISAFQRRLAALIDDQHAALETLTAAHAGIDDTDYARDSAVRARSQFLQSAASAMLAQANVLPRNVIALLKA